MTIEELHEGDDCTKQFRKAYENRYTWDSSFSGYKGNFSWEDGIKNAQGSFILSADFKVDIKEIDEPIISKSVSSQLWEVAIHRVRRDFNDVHQNNTFQRGDINNIGTEVIVGGKNIGDKYRIKDDIVTMVYRHIHGSLINIFTKEVINTKSGYISSKYSSQYLDISSGKELKPLNSFCDKFEPLTDEGPYVLTQREILTEDLEESKLKKQVFKFFELSPIN
tara:strand:+ start:4394 stop:5059 length:666 start_codon:yes stop_codon:yes gene_type:complete